MASPEELHLDWLRVDPLGLDTSSQETFSLKEFDAQFFRLAAGFKVWLSGQWVEKPVRVWDGQAWVVKPIKVWDASAWL